MNAMKILMMLMAALFAALLFVGCSVKTGYNKAMRLDEAVKTSWADIESQLQRRFDLFGNLMATVKGVAQQEKDVFLGIAKARESYFQAKSVPQKAAANGLFQSALSRLLVLRETYPELKSNESFMKLQDSVEGTENRIGVRRDRYNGAVKNLNTYVRSFFGRFYASWADVQQAEYFEVKEEAKAVPKIDFSQPAGG